MFFDKMKCTLLGFTPNFKLGENSSNGNVNNKLSLTVTKTESILQSSNFEKVVPPDAYVFLLPTYFIDKIMRITHAKFQAKN